MKKAKLFLPRKFPNIATVPAIFLLSQYLSSFLSSGTNDRFLLLLEESLPSSEGPLEFPCSAAALRLFSEIGGVIGANPEPLAVLLAFTCG